MPDLSVIIPAYNEKENLPVIIRKCFDQIERVEGNHQVIVLDDGSNDGTDQVLKDLSEQFPDLVCLSHLKNQGIGRSLADLIKHAKCEFIVFIPADLQVWPDQIPVLLSGINEYDLLMGWRKNRKDPLLRKLLSAIYNKILRLTLKIPLHDIDGVFIVRKNKIDKMNFQSNGAIFSAEMLCNFMKKHYNIGEVEVEHHPRKKGKQSGASIKTIISIIPEFISLFMRQVRS